jgi:hypothetical protein
MSKMGNYPCSVARGSVSFRVTTPSLYGNTAERIDAEMVFKSCTGHPQCGKFPRGLPQVLSELPPGPTGCPFVDTGEIKKWL